MNYSPSIPRTSENSSSVKAVEPTTSESPGDSEVVLHERRPVFKNGVYSVFADHVTDKQGHEVERYLSVVPNRLVENAVAGVAILPTYEGKVGLLRIFRHPLRSWSWEAIKGHVEDGEELKTAAARELREETGFAVSPASVIKLGTVAPEAAIIRGRSCLFTVVVDGYKAGGAETELGHGEMVFLSLEEVRNLIAEGEIEDAITLCAFYKYSEKALDNNLHRD
tara:strand:- start:64 stop:732 length:669 start_codon:yes stop_codon:yes gene_type:complete